MPKNMTIVSKSFGAPLSDVDCQARIVMPGASGTTVTEEGPCLTSSNVSTITYAVYDVSSATPSTAVGTGTLTAGTVFITLVDDDQWNADSTGCNFRATIPGTLFATQMHTYWIVFTLVTSAGTGSRKRIWTHEHYVERAYPE